MIGEDFLEKFISKNTISEIGEVFGFKGMEIDPERMTAYAMSGKFMKRSYSGEFKNINDRILNRQEFYKKILGISTFSQLKMEIRDYILMQTMASMFARLKQAYRFDHEFMDVLLETDDVKIPLSTFVSLPFTTFYLDLDSYAAFHPFFGCLVTVLVDPETRLPGISILRFMKQDGMKEELIFSAYLTGDDLLKHGMAVVHDGEVYVHICKKLIAADIERNVNAIAGIQGAKSFSEPNVREFILFVMQAILYLGSYKPDISEQPAMKKKRNAVKILGSLEKTEIKKWDVGVRYGNTIRMDRKEHWRISREQEGRNTGDGNDAPHHNRAPVRPHVRAAHWHTYWVGKGRTERIVKWIPPVFVCGKEIPITVHKVKGN